MPITCMVMKSKKKVCSKLATGEWFGAYCLTEPGADLTQTQGKRKVLSGDEVTT